MTTRLSRFEWACVAILALAFGQRVWFIANPEIGWDSAWYLMLARSFGESGTFLIPFTNPPEYSGYWPPLFPILLSPLVQVFGASYHTLVAGSVLATAALCAAVFLTTRASFDRRRAFAATAAVAASPAFLLSDSRGLSESLIALFVALAVWAYVKSLDKPAWLVATGGFAALAYLGKATLGVGGVAALLVLALALRAKRLRKAEIVAVGVGIAALALTVILRSGTLGGLGLSLIGPARAAVVEPLFFPVFLFKIAFCAAFLLTITLPFSLELRAAWAARKGERESVLWLAVALPILAAAVFSTSFYFTEKRDLVDFDNVRYLTPSFVPLLWLLLPAWQFEAGEARGEVSGHEAKRWHNAWWGAAALGFALLLFLNPNAGVPSLRRLFALLALSAVALLFSRIGMQGWWRAFVREGKRASETRFEKAKAPSTLGAASLGLLAIGGVLAYAVSYWYATIAIGAAITIASPSPRARAAVMMLFLFASVAPGFHTTVPYADIDAVLPEGASVALRLPAVYYAAVAPEGATLSLEGATNATYLVVHGAPDPLANYTVVRSFDYEFDFTPSLQARFWLEGVIGNRPDIQTHAAVTVYQRAE